MTKLRRGTRKTRKTKADVSLPITSWDMGPDTEQQRHLKVIEAAGDVDADTGEIRNPNGVKRSKRVSVAEYYQKRKYINQRQASAARALLASWEATQRRPPAIKEINVDSSPQPDANIAVTLDRVIAHIEMTNHIPAAFAREVLHVACYNGYLNELRGYKKTSSMARLVNGLEGLADNLGL